MAQCIRCFLEVGCSCNLSADLLCVNCANPKSNYVIINNNQNKNTSNKNTGSVRKLGYSN